MPDRQPAATTAPSARAADAALTSTPPLAPGVGLPPAAAGPGAAADGPRESPDEREPSAPGWPPRDILPPFVLLAISLQRAHGYVIEDYLRALGLFGITMSTLYRTLRQMERDGFVESAWEPGPTGPARRVYTITDAGHAWLDASAAMLTAYRETIDRFFGLYDAGPGATRQRSNPPSNEEE